MTTTGPVTREAQTAWTLTDGAGPVTGQGEGTAVVTDDGLTVGDVAVSFLDADGFQAADYAITLDLWPAGRLVLARLGRRFETFAAALAAARTRARLAGLLAHGIDAPAVFDGALLDPEGARTGPPGRPAQFLLYSTHVAVAPADADPFQAPYGGMATCRLDGPGRVTCEGPGGTLRIGQLGRQGDAVLHALETRRAALQRIYAEATGTPVFRDGVGVPRSELPQFDRLVARLTAPERRPMAETILAAVTEGEPRLGLVTLLDMDGEAHAAEPPLPENIASFLLAPVGDVVVLELLSGPSAATYAFAGGIGAVNQDLQTLHFRRAPLALSEAHAALEPANPYRLALRRLAPLQRLRAATRARVIHNEGWGECFGRDVLEGGSSVAG
ncbi:MAG TPA: hypothetical protein VFS40_06185 [Gemmatimonadales bacterium]|nr:hypothetical protein [Gemmatimonadales bacterium]